MSNITEAPAQKYYVLHVPGGGLHGILPIVSLKFLETMTRLPLSKQFNMSAGSSTGSIPLTALNIPKSEDSNDPRYSADDILDFYKTIGPRIFPHRRGYYVRQMVMDLIKLAHGFFTALADLSANKADKLTNFLLNSVGHQAHKILTKDKPYIPLDSRLFRNMHKWIFTPLNNKLKRGIDSLINESLYDISVLSRILDATLRYEDNNGRVNLGKTLISHHVTAHNLTRDEPAIFFHFKDPKTGDTQFLSNPEMELDSIVLGSCAAQTIFKSPTLRNGETYVDIADFDTMRTPISSIDRQADKKLDIKLITIGTGEKNAQIDVEGMNSMLFLQQMIAELGGYLFGIRKRYINKMADLDLKYRLGAENIIKIDLPLVQESLNQDYLKDPRVPAIAEFMGVDMEMLNITELPSADLFDSNPENLRRLEATGWAMAFKNLDTMMPLCKELVENARSLGHITAEEADERISLIEHFNGAAKNGSGYTIPGQVHGPQRKQHWFTFEEIRERTLKEKITFLFKRAVGIEQEPVHPRPDLNDKVDKKADQDVPPPPPTLHS